MKRLCAVGLLILLGLAGGFKQANASEGFDEVVKLVKSGAGEDVILAFVDVSRVAYDLTVDEILFLNDLGVSPKITSAILRHGKALREAAPAVVPPRPPVASPPAPAVEPVVVQREPLAPAPVVSTLAPVATAPPPAEPNISYFYESLSPYGNWVEVNGAWCWRPTVALEVGWRPYCHRGHWVLTDYGWTWCSDYSWGWAPFHYGRWALDPVYGWVWTPGTVWGPAWVSWRMCDTHYGWAPLPPAAVFEAGVGFKVGGVRVGLDFDFGLGAGAFVFVHSAHFCEANLAVAILPHAEVDVVFRRTTLIRDTFVVHEGRFINHGPAVEVVARATGREIREIRVADAERPGHEVKGSLAFYRPKIAEHAPEAPPAIIKRQQKEAEERIAKQAARTEVKEIREDKTIERKQAVETKKDNAETKAAEKAVERDTTREIKREDASTKASEKAIERESTREVKRTDNSDLHVKAAEEAANKESSRSSKTVERETSDKELAPKSSRRTEQEDTKAANDVRKIRESDSRESSRDTGRDSGRDRDR